MSVVQLLRIPSMRSSIEAHSQNRCVTIIRQCASQVFVSSGKEKKLSKKKNGIASELSDSLKAERRERLFVVHITETVMNQFQALKASHPACLLAHDFNSSLFYFRAGNWLQGKTCPVFQDCVHIPLGFSPEAEMYFVCRTLGGYSCTNELCTKQHYAARFSFLHLCMRS